MTSNSSLHTLSEQIISFNNNVLNILNNISSMITSTEQSINFNYTDSEGKIINYNFPTVKNLIDEINISNNNFKSLIGLNNGSKSSIIQTSPNSFNKIVTVDLNLEPNDITSLEIPSYFVADKNWIFDNMISPELSIELDLNNKIEDSTRTLISRRYIINFEIDSTGAFTANGQSALNSFNNTYKGTTNINQNDFLLWLQTTPGVVGGLNPNYDEKQYNLEPNELNYQGYFSVIKIVEDSLNNKLWYHLNTLSYSDVQTNQTLQLKTGDTFIINIDNSNTKYQIVEISYSGSLPMVTLLRIEGMQPVPVGVNTLKYYSNVLKNKKIKINIGYNQYCVLFVKALNNDNYIISKNWSSGIGFYTNDLILKSSDNFNGQTMPSFYTYAVNDYGAIFKDLAERNVPLKLGVPPTAPVLNVNNFQIVQTNLHLTNTPDSLIIKKQSAQVNKLNLQLQQLSTAIASKNKQQKINVFTTDAEKNQFTNELKSLQEKYNSVSTLKNSVNTQIIKSSTNNVSNVLPTFAVKGFITIPSPINTNNTLPLNIVQLEYQYKRLSKDGSETPINTTKLYDTAVNPNFKTVGAISNWKSVKTNPLHRKYDIAKGVYTWVEEDISDPDVVNMNEVDIPINKNETIQLRVRSISEVGFPDSPLMSDWSNVVNIEFPDNLNSIGVQNDTNIITLAHTENVKNTLINDLNNKGLDELLSQKVTLADKTYYVSAENILTDYKDVNGIVYGLQALNNMLIARITKLEEQIAMTKGVLLVSIFNDKQQFVVSNNSELNFTINCEDYLDKITGPGIPTGRVYSNQIYVVNNYVLRIQNTSLNSPLGLLSNRTYSDGVNSDVYNNSTPQVLWVDNHDELLLDNTSGVSKTQLDNQFLWMVNYDSVGQVGVTKISDNIGNSFIGNNSITNILSSPDYNVGYSENSVLTFVGNNNSLLDTSKWLDVNPSVSSRNKLLTTIHPSVSQLSNIVETNSVKTHNLLGGDNNDIKIPLNIYFKMNALDNTITGADYQYINLNGVTQNVRHTKRIKFLLDNKADNTPFEFSVVFTINRVNSVQKKIIATSPIQTNAI